MVLGAFGWIVAALSTNQVVQLLGLTAAGVFSMAVWSLFFTMPSAVLPRRAHAVGIAFMNTIGMCGAATFPLIIGVLRDRTGGFAGSMIFVGLAILAGAGLMLFVPKFLLTGDGGRVSVPARAGAE